MHFRLGQQVFSLRRVYCEKLLDLSCGSMREVSYVLFQVRDLCVISKADGALLHKTEGRAKNYVALCRVNDPTGSRLSAERLASISKSDCAMILKQKTPLRVLHR